RPVVLRPIGDGVKRFTHDADLRGMVVLRSLGFQLVPFKLHRFRKQRHAGDFKGMLAWFDKAIDTGNENSLAMASYFLMEDDITSMSLPEQYQDPVKAYALNYILWQYAPNNSDEDFSPSINLKNLDKKLSKAEKDQAIAWAQEWMKGHQVRTYGLVFN
ncbi:hypothetical protein, partial [Aeromonas sp.]|uniref:hypothetical protein n=1 Tax=Aeromonas sp. TaxID=647 RepID=UPI002588D693